MNLQIVPTALLVEYNKKQKFTLQKHVNEIYSKRNSLKTLKFVLSSVYSSLIEGSQIDMDTYLLNKKTGFQNKEMQQIDDLITSYQFAQNHVLNEKNFIQSHLLLSKNFSMDKKYIGKYRKDVEVRVGNWQHTVYRGCEAKNVQSEMEKLFADIEILKKQKLSYNEAFYYASMIHLVFVKIHPFADGNGRAARLLEKWFLASTLENKTWYIPSEAHYSQFRQSYYDNLKIGTDYASVNYEASLQFLLMLPNCFKLSKKIYLT